VHWYNYAIILPIVVFLLASLMVAFYWLINPVSRDEFFSTSRTMGIAVGVGAFLCAAIVVMLGMAEMTSWITNSSAEWWLEESEYMPFPSGLAGTLGFFATIGLVSVYTQVAKTVEKVKRSEYVEERVRELLSDARGLTPSERALFLGRIAKELGPKDSPAAPPKKKPSDFERLQYTIVARVSEELEHAGKSDT
jgi:hypothetical protein